MKVMQIVADGNPGGGTTNVLALTEDLLTRGIDVVFCSQRDSYAIGEARRLGARVRDGLDFFRGRIDSRIVRQLRSAVDEVAPDIVHAHGGRAAFAWLRGSDRAYLRRTIYTVRGYQFWRKRFPMRFLAQQAERRISRSIFRTVHVSSSDQDTAIRQALVSDRSTTRVIRNGICLADIPPANAGTAEGPEHRKQVAVLGRLTYPKNPDLVLDLARELASEGFVFHLIGGGELETPIRQRIARENIDNVVMHGKQSRANGLRIMARFGTFLLASLWEGLPMAPIEAMAMGLAVVISDVNGCTEVVRDGIDGRVAASEDRRAFASALRAVVNEPDQTARMIDSAKQRVAAEFTRDRVLREHLDLYQACISENQLRDGTAILA